MLFLKRELLSIKEENENISNIVYKINYFKDKLDGITEKISSTNMVIITLNGMLDEYQIFIFNLTSKEKYLRFDEFSGIVLKE